MAGFNVTSALAHRRVLKMNGLGNQITVLDLRGSAHRVTADETRAIASHERTAFDQLMVLHDAVTPGTDAFVRIYNTDGSEAGACGNGTRCLAWALTYDAEMAKFSARHELQAATWTQRVLNRLGPIKAMNGRETLRAALAKMGFEIR